FSFTTISSKRCPHIANTGFFMILPVARQKNAGGTVWGFVNSEIAEVIVKAPRSNGWFLLSYCVFCFKTILFINGKLMKTMKYI
ncbi:MAG: hypothetical protein WAM28_05130, partial [Chlamydiales bacterium]